MYELLTLVDEERPFIIVEHPSRVVYTFGKRDRAFAEEVLDRLNNPELIPDDEDSEDPILFVNV
jgi:hypothetical protein